MEKKKQEEMSKRKQQYTKKFAGVYNKFWAWFSIERAEVFKKFIKNKKHKSLLDLACGSGQFVNELAQNFETIQGLDLSPGLLEFARVNNKKHKNIDFYLGDMTNFDLGRKFDFVTCNFDAVNHLEDFSDWENFFKCSQRHLESDGYFIFDFNTTTCIKEGNASYYKQHDFWDEIYSSIVFEGKFIMSYIIYDKDKSGKYEKTEKTIMESVFENKQVFDAMKKAGFSRLKICNSNLEPLSKEDAEKESRLFVVAQI